MNSDNTKNYILQTKGVSKVIKIKKRMQKIVSDVSIEVSSNDLVVVFGAVGSGKTSLLRIILGIDKPDLGEVIIRNEKLYDYAEDEIAFIRLRKMGIMTKDMHWIMGLDIYDNLAFGMRMANQDEGTIRSRIETVSKDLSIEIKKIDYADLSDLKKRKLSILREIVKKPWILFLDDPAEGLSDDETKDIFDYIKKINSEYKIPILLFTHNVEHLEIADKWFFLKDGSVEDLASSRNPISRLKKAISIVESQENIIKNDF
jgi:ABC-type lipoprotein export system ATPase subunit